MIISHKHRFIFVKTTKTAGTSIEIFLSQYCGREDVVTPIFPHVEPHQARNHRGFWNPFPELAGGASPPRRTFGQLAAQKKFYNHMSARLLRARVGAATWNSYFKFCVERNPWDKTLSHYHMHRDRSGGKLGFEHYLAAGRFPTNFDKYTDDAGQVMVDEILRYETLQEELSRVFARLSIPFHGLNATAKREHRTDRRDYREVYSSEQRDLVGAAFSREIRLLCYTF